MEQLRSRCRNSIGFSMVTTCLCSVRLMWCTMAATVELLPLPLTPLTSTSPRSDSAIDLSTSGRASDSMVGTVNGITRITIMNEERCRRIFTRNRPTPGIPQEQSKSRMRSIRARSSSLLISFSAIDLVWSGVSRCLVRGTSLPLIRARKTSPALMCRSEAPRSTAALMIFSNGSAGVRGRAKLRSGFAPGGKGLWRGTQKSHPVANLSHGFRGHAVGSCGPIRQDLVHSIRLFPELQGTLPDWGEGRDHIIGQYPLAVEAPPLGAPAVLGHQGDGFWWGEVLVQVINIAYLRGTGITPGHASRIRFR